MVSGSRSSWLASWTNSRWLRMTASSRSSIALKLRAISDASSPPLALMRRVRSDWEIERAVSVSSCTGRRTRPARR